MTASTVVRNSRGRGDGHLWPRGRIRAKCVQGVAHFTAPLVAYGRGAGLALRITHRIETDERTAAGWRGSCLPILRSDRYLPGT